MTCDTDVCGTGGWTGPKPGDPDNNLVLSAVPAFGGIEVSWTYPAINPSAVAHVLLYRALSADFNGAVQIAVVAGNRYYDRLDTGTTYYYWIQMVSIYGTVGDRIGPAHATANPLIQDLIERLTGQIDAGVLAQSLKTQIDKITLNYADLTSEIANRLSGDDGLSVTLSQIQGNVDSALAAVQSEIATRQSGDSALAEQIDIVAASSQDTAALVEAERLARVDADSSLAQRVDALYAAGGSGDAAAAVQDVEQTKIGYSALASDATTPYDGDGVTVVYPVATYPSATYPDYGANRTRVLDRTGVDSWNSTSAGLAKPLVWVVGLPLASAVKTVQITDANGNQASVQQSFVAQKTLNDGFKALYTAKVTVNGLIGGFGIYNNGTSVEAGFDVDTFWVGRTSADKRKPFIISGGVVYIDEGAINRLTFSKLRDESGNFIVSNGQVLAQYIDTKGLAIRDAAGNVIFSSGVALDWTRITGTGKPANNATVNNTTSGTLAQRPAGADGDFYFATDTATLYQKLAGVWNVSGTVGAPAGTLVNGVSVATVTAAVTNFNSSNDRNAAPIAAPVIFSDGTAVDHTLQANGSADVSLEWQWPNSANTMAAGITGYLSGTTLTVTGVTPGKVIAGMLLTGVVGAAPVAGTSVLNQISSAETDGSLGGKGTYTITPSQALGSAAAPVSLVATPTFTGSIAITSASLTTLTVTAIGTRTLSLGSVLSGSTVLPGTWIVSQLTSTEAGGALGGKGTYSVNLPQTVGSATLGYTQSDGDIDGFQVIVAQSTTAGAYAIGTTPVNETVYEVPASKRAFILYGVVPNAYYTFGVRAYRGVDKDITPSGIVLSAMSQPPLAAENPYQPSAQVAFSGNVTGTVNGIAASDVNIWTSISGSGKPADGATKNQVFRQANPPTVGMTTNDIWFDTTTGTTYSYSGATWIRVGDVTANNTAKNIQGQGALATQNMATVGITVNFPDGSTMLTTDFVNRLSKIGTNNISTFMDNAAIGSAYIGNLAVKNAHIENLTIGTEKVGIGQMTAAYAVGGTNGSATLNPVVVPDNAAALQITTVNADFAQYDPSTDNMVWHSGAVTIINQSTGVSYASASAGGIIVNPPAGNYYVSVTQYGSGTGGLQLLAQVFKR